YPDTTADPTRAAPTESPPAAVAACAPVTAPASPTTSTGTSAIVMATADLVTTNPALPHGVSPSWRPQPWKRSSAAPLLIAVVAVTAPYTAIETMTAAPTLPRSRGSSVYDWAEPNTRYMMSGRDRKSVG